MSFPFCNIARVSLHHVAHGEDSVGANAIEIACRGLQIWQAPIAASGAVRKNRDSKRAFWNGHGHHLLIYIWFAFAQKRRRRSGARGGQCQSERGACHGDEGGRTQQEFVSHGEICTRTSCARRLQCGACRPWRFTCSALHWKASAGTATKITPCRGHRKIESAGRNCLQVPQSTRSTAPRWSALKYAVDWSIAIRVPGARRRFGSCVAA